MPEGLDEADPDRGPESDAPLESVRFSGLAPGPKLLVLGAVHGNETCGPVAISRMIEACRSGALPIRRGAVTFVPMANPKAFRRRTREGDRNLNRDLRERPAPRDHEDRVGNVLCALLREHDVLLDLHSFSAPGDPFVFLGPEDNQGDLEPFGHGEAEGAFAACLGAPTAIYGWLPQYAHLIAERRRLGLPPLPPTEGRGTTEFMRAVGGYGVTLECGRHGDPAAADVAHRAIVAALAHFELGDAPRPVSMLRRVVRLAETVICERPGDRLEGVWTNGDAVARGRIVARRASGDPVAAVESGFIVFPDPNAKPGQIICHLGVHSRRAL